MSSYSSALKMTKNENGRSPYFQDSITEKCFPRGELSNAWDQTFVEEQMTGLCGSLIGLEAQETRKLTMYQRVCLSTSNQEVNSREDRPVSRNHFFDSFHPHEKIIKA